MAQEEVIASEFWKKAPVGKFKSRSSFSFVYSVQEPLRSGSRYSEILEHSLERPLFLHYSGVLLDHPCRLIYKFEDGKRLVQSEYEFAQRPQLFRDLEEALTQKYGEPHSANTNGWDLETDDFFYFIWHTADGETQIDLHYYNIIGGSRQVSLKYSDIKRTKAKAETKKKEKQHQAEEAKKEKQRQYEKAKEDL